MYVVGYYIKDPKKKELFELQQNDLEMLCEQIQGLTEKDLKVYADTNEVDRSPFYLYRGELINLTKLLNDQYRKYY